MGNKKKLFIALPIYGGIDPGFHASCLNLVRQMTIGNPGFDVDIKHLFGDSAIGRARNTLTRLFLESDATHMLFIDSDLTFSVDHVRRIMEHDDDVVGGLYCKKQDGPNAELVINCCNNPEQIDSGPRDGLMTVRYIGTGFMRIARSVFEKMIERYPEIAYKEDPDHKKTAWDFWHMGVYDYAKNGYPNDWAPRYLSEDWWFCQRCQDLGIKVWADRRIGLKHAGSALFPLRHQEEKLSVYKPVKPEEATETPIRQQLETV
jgi:hypothetical protein